MQRLINERTTALQGQICSEEETEEVTISIEEARKVIDDLQKNWIKLSNKEKVSFLTKFIDSIQISNIDRVVHIDKIKFINPNLAQEKEPQYVKLLK